MSASGPARPRIVASLIVRDEADVIDDCLASLRDVVDEIVVCDTGSSDDTVARCRAAGATVVEFDWVDDFAAARNASLDACSDAGWVLWIDADERLLVEDRQALESSLGDEANALLVPVENRRTGLPTSVSTATRLFRGGGVLRFDGAIHERLVRVDGGPLRTSPASGVSLVHLGYDPEAADVAAKAERNLRIARSVHATQPTARTALDLVRSLGLSGAAAEEMIEVASFGLELAEVDDPDRLDLLATRSNQRLRGGDAVGGFEDASQVLEASWDDVAALVLARAATDLGRDQVLAEAFVSRPRVPHGIAVPGNRAEALCLAAAAGLRVGDAATAESLVKEALDLDTPDRWATVVAALAGGDPHDTLSLLAGVGSEDLEGLLSVVTAAWGSEAAGAVRRLSGESIGITFDFGGSRLPVAIEDLIRWAPRGSTIIEWTGDQRVAESLAPQAGPITSLAAWPEIEHHATGSIDLAIGGVTPEQVSDALAAIHDVMDPAGVVALWLTDERGIALYPSSIAHIDDRLDAAVLAEAGFAAEVFAPHGIVAARPIDPTTAVRSPEESLSVWSPIPLPDGVRAAYRSAIPGSYEIDFVDGDSIPDGPEDLPVLVVGPDVVPEPGWIRRCLQEVGPGAPVAPALIDGAERIVQAGVAPDGRVFGAGDRWNSPFFQVARSAVTLQPPFVSLRSDLGVAPTGTVLGQVAARSSSSAGVEPGSSVPLGELVPRSVLFVGAPAPGDGDAPVVAAIEKCAARLASVGATAVYQWEDRSWPADPVVLDRLRSLGVIAVPPSMFRREPIRFMPDPAAPRADAVAEALVPDLIVYLSDTAEDWDFESLARRSVTPSLRVTDDDGGGRQRTDETCRLSEMPDRVLAMLETTRPASEPDIPVIDPIATADGLVSIVIPVFNKWDLTKRCLRSIRKHTRSPHEIVVVDNASSDGTAAGLAEFDVKVVSNAENLGFPAAVNQGIAAARGEFVCVLNNDTEVTPGWLDALLDALSVPGTGIVGPRSNRITGLQQVPNAPSLEGRPAAHRWAKEWATGHAGRSWPIARLVGFCFLARRSLFEDLGGLDEGFGIGNFEDDEFGFRVTASGLGLRVADGSVVLHHGSATFQRLDIDFTHLLHRARRHLGARTGGDPMITTLVLSDGNPIGAAAAAATASMVTDRVVVAERGPMASTEIAVAAVRTADASVVQADWASDEGGADVLEGLTGAVLVVGSNERIDAADWGAARAALDGHRPGPAAIDLGTGSEVRLVPAAPDSLARIGSPATDTVPGVRIVPGSA